MDETRVMLCILASIKVLVSRDDLRDYRGAAVKRTMVTAIECISANACYHLLKQLDHVPYPWVALYVL
ncbi:uncharacterized protein LY89DRAFT_662462 [Mollisia scopiformis]|uniref:Uncharacterized protein n=1 Tax=Mollisia scopiformis TaxID=149040 RepID=A0A132B1Q4_MOLSC|nr:uncharacterized protein LY89DRAFT_662462 [Mollisia scopiformis]KUJ06163.1 hypothetical protein LY89DRAFT_662462 [Mollisia scopiformis]